MAMPWATNFMVLILVQIQTYHVSGLARREHVFGRAWQTYLWGAIPTGQHSGHGVWVWR
jgi:hypothetical protein